LTLPTLQVVAGVLRRPDGRVLLAQRPPGKAMAGKWELPGGKVRTGESLHAALVRELHEELGVCVERSTPLIQLTHDYPDRRVVLHTRDVCCRGEPQGLEGQALQWVLPTRMHEVDLLEADAPIVTALSLPSRYLITPPDLTDPEALGHLLEHAIGAGVRLLQLRAPRASVGELDALAARAATVSVGQPSLRWLIGGDPAETVAVATRHGAHGLHLPSRFAEALAEVRAAAPGCSLLGVSCHDREELARAADLGAHFALLGPVRPTPSHPDASGIGWERFAAEVADLALPVYAIGGLGDGDVGAAREAGAQGVAGIRQIGRMANHSN
jgi:8-oxo-dGTP diphosphatase